MFSEIYNLTENLCFLDSDENTVSQSKSDLVLHIYAVLVFNNLSHSALEDHKSQNDGDSSYFSRLYVFQSIRDALQPSKLLYKLGEKSAKFLFFESNVLSTKFGPRKQIDYVPKTSNFSMACCYVQRNIEKFGRMRRSRLFPFHKKSKMVWLCIDRSPRRYLQIKEILN